MYILRCLLTQRLFSRCRYLGGTLALLASFLLLSVSATFAPAYAASTAKTPPAAWHTFHDPVYGFSLTYPDTWTLTTESNGSHITLLNPATKTTISPIVSTQNAALAAVLKQALPAQSIDRRTQTVAGHQAVDYLLPYISAPRAHSHDAMEIGGPQQTRQVIIPVTNAAGTTNVYTFRLTQPTSVTGKISVAEQVDHRTFEAILKSFTLPIKIVSSRMASVATNTSGCDRVCWADNNWNFTDYTDANTVPNVDGTYWQPNFQCAEFVARAITQDGMLPGLNNGGANGNYSPGSDQNSYGFYGSNGNTYDLLDVGVPGIVGLHDYLTDSGLATNIGQNMSQAQAGDVVFFNNGSGTNYYHTMIIVSIGNGGLYLDGHNEAQYHTFITTGNFDIYHFRTTANISTSGITTAYNGQQWTAKMQPDNHIEISNRQSNYYFTDTTRDTPSIAFLKGEVFVAFVGNDEANQIHFFYGTLNSSTRCPASNPCHFPGYILYNSSQTASETTGHAPALSSDATHLYLAFAGTEGGNTGHIHMEQTTDGTTSASWGNRADLAGTTNNTPSTTASNGQQWVAYRGTDGRINLATSQNNYAFTDTTNGTPAISFLNGMVFVAFVGNDNSGQIHLFYGAISDTTSCAGNNACHYAGYILNDSSQQTAEKAAGSPGLTSTATTLYLAFPGAETPPAHTHIEETSSGTSSASWGNRADLGV